ncbi:MAG: hypothetical protein ABIP58_06685 [Dehalococcoidia bacterium]
MATTSLLDRALYRTRQLISAIRPHVTKTELEAAHHTLGDDLIPLFTSMQPADQRHCLDVFERLLQDGSPDNQMLQAALIHDCGKGSLTGANITLPDRVAFVLLAPFPGAIAKASRRPGIAALRDHSQKTLALARSYGAGDGVVSLIEEMDGLRTAGARGEALKRADDLN